MSISKEIVEKLKLTQQIVEEAKIKEVFQSIAFEKTFDLLANNKESSKPSPAIKKEEGEQHNQIQMAKTFAGLLRQTNAKSHSEKVLMAAYHFMKNNKITFTKEDIESAYQDAYLPKSKNTSVEIKGLIKKGLLMPTKDEVEGKKSFQITMDGINFVEEELIKNDKK